MRSLLLALVLAPSVAEASNSTRIPAFARKYKVTCATCHSPVPRLNATGEAFAANGFEFKPGEAPRDTIATGDPLLRLQNSLPLAIRYDAYLTAYSKREGGQVVYDQQTPWVIKLLSGGQVANKVSYYAYFLLTEQGSVEGLEDAYIQFTDVGGSGINLVAGQFQVSDPMFKRETRLPYEDYQAYRMSVGVSPVTLTYDRGFMATWEPHEGTDLAFELVNGRGLNGAGEDRQFDRDNGKSLIARLSQNAGPLRVGVFTYFGKEEFAGAKNTVRMLGPDLTLSFSDKLELNGQFLQRRDEDPFLGTCTPASPCPTGATGAVETTVNGAFVEAILSPKGNMSRHFLTALFNHIDANQPVVSLRLGETSLLQRYTTAGLGAHYLYRRNIRFMTEAHWDVEREQARFVGGFTLAF